MPGCKYKLVRFVFPTAQGEAKALEQEVSMRRRTIAEKRSRLEEELQIQAHIREDIEVKICP